MFSPMVPLSAAESNTPNIVFIMAGDIGCGDLSCYRATKVKTPHCDRAYVEE